MRERQSLAVASAFAAAIVVGSPLAGRVRAAAVLAFPASFTLLVGGAIGVAVGAGVLVGLARINDRRATRYASLAAAVLSGSVMAWLLRTGNTAVDVVEAFHFVEYGFLTLLFYLAWHPLGDAASLVVPVLAALLVGVLDEWFQWFLPGRVGELRDLAIDGSAIACGLLFSVGFKPPVLLTFALGEDSRQRIGRLLIILILAWSAFFRAAFMGHEVAVDAAARFRSRFADDELRRISSERAGVWRQHPPQEDVGLFRREDQYLSEALWHVARRNETAAAGDFPSAWWENRILETFYAPVIDIVAPDGTSHRWVAEQRSAVERQAAADGRPFVSAAEPYRIYLWPADRFWAANALLVGIVSIVCLHGGRKERTGVRRRPIGADGSRDEIPTDRV